MQKIGDGQAHTASSWDKNSHAIPSLNCLGTSLGPLSQKLTSLCNEWTTTPQEHVYRLGKNVAILASSSLCETQL